MSQNLYIASTHPRSGKSVIILGLMEWLTQQKQHIGLFRPIVLSHDVDPVIDLIYQRYNLELPRELSYGCTLDEARDLIANNRINELLKLIIGKFKDLEEQCDRVLCVGTDFGYSMSAMEFDFNADVANNLGCQIIPVINAKGLDLASIQDSIFSTHTSLKERRCDIRATIINRVHKNSFQALKNKLEQWNQDHSNPVYALPGDSVLDKPAVGDITQALGAHQLLGCPEDLLRATTGYKIAAMELPHYLDHLEDANLIVTPGDRSDIILGSISAHHASTYPQISCLLLSGGLEPAPQVRQLLSGLAESPIPVFIVETDTFDTAMAVSQVKARLSADNPRKIAVALELMETHVDLARITDEDALGKPRRITPLIFEYELIRRAKSQRQHIVLPEGSDDRILRAAEILLLRDVVDLTILGDTGKITSRARALGIKLERAAIVDPLSSEWRQEFADRYFELRQHKGISEQMAMDTIGDVSYFGTMMVLQGYADGMVSGAIHTTQHTIRPSFEVIKTRPGAKLVSSVFLMCMPDRVLVYGDCAVNPNPNADELADIALASAETACSFGITPRVAMLSYSTGDSGKGSEVEKVRQATLIARGRAPDLKLDGPIQYDAAIDPEVASSKLPDSEVAGQATVFIFPDLNTGNNTYKAVQRSTGAVAIGPVLQGLNRPINDLSRGCSVTDIVNTVAITAIQAQQVKAIEPDY
jgi:phosphate acetyltransferase